VTGRVELDPDTSLNITMSTTVPIALPSCNDVSFFYDHAVSGVKTTDCEAYFRDARPEHPITVRAEGTPGCRSYSSLIEFKPYSKPGALMWENYVPNNITVK